MAYRRRQNRGGYRKKRYTRKGATWRTYAGKALSLAGKQGIKMLKKKLGLNTENKNWDVTATQTSTASMASFLSPTVNLAQGNTNQTRNGNGIRITHYKFRGVVYNDSGNTNYQRVRIVFVRQEVLQPVGDFVTPAQLMQDVTNIDSPYNTDLQGVKVIHDQTYMIKPYSTGTIAQTPVKIKWTPGYDEGHVQWSDADTTGATTNLTKGLIRGFFMTDQATLRPFIIGYGRVHFVDN